MARMVLLHHTLPDGTSHHDWMIEPPAAGLDSSAKSDDANARDLVTFRISERIDEKTVTRFSAFHLENHRRLYLAFEGDIGPSPHHPAGPSRGIVRRIAQGTVSRLHTPTADMLEVYGAFDGQPACLWRGTAERHPTEPKWSFVRTPDEPAVPPQAHRDDSRMARCGRWPNIR